MVPYLEDIYLYHSDFSSKINKSVPKFTWVVKRLLTLPF